MLTAGLHSWHFVRFRVLEWMDRNASLKLRERLCVKKRKKDIFHTYLINDN